jgi:hypothetical protein
VRSDWQCPECKLCQTCRQPGDDTKVIVCESCDKCYHSYCLKHDTISSAATTGWQCDSCSKELTLLKTCTVCRHPLLRDTLACEFCIRKQQSLLAESKKKSALRDLLLQQQHHHHQSSNLSNSPDSITQNPSIKREHSDISEDAAAYEAAKKPQITARKKQPVTKKTNGVRNLKRSNSQLSVNLNGNSMRSGRSTRNGNGGKENKNGGEGGSRRNGGSSSKDQENSQDADNNNYSDDPTIGQIKRDDEDHHAVTIIASLDDSFILKHDLCLSCGSFGRQDEDTALACSQCGQCFHHYCSGISTLNNVMKERGWRCLDCTVCEGCGTATDESRLLLCDDCDISYHIYCLSPPLDQVPKGNWKCKWCVKCVKCGARSPGGKKMEWKNNYTECALCNSVTSCHLCQTAYKESELIGKCGTCERWSHLSCKSHLSDEEAEKQYGQAFTCIR